MNSSVVVSWEDPEKNEPEKKFEGLHYSKVSVPLPNTKEIKGCNYNYFAQSCLLTVDFIKLQETNSNLMPGGSS